MKKVVPSSPKLSGVNGIISLGLSPLNGELNFEREERDQEGRSSISVANKLSKKKEKIKGSGDE